MLFNGSHKLAVLIDGENMSRAHIDTIMREVSEIGEPVVVRVYADWSNPHNGNWKNCILRYAITPVQQFNYTPGKNSSDFALLLDALEILQSGKVTGFAIVTSDADFTPLVIRLRQNGMFVVGIGERKAHASFVEACNHFIFTETSGMASTSDQLHTLPAETVKRSRARGLNRASRDRRKAEENAAAAAVQPEAPAEAPREEVQPVRTAEARPVHAHAPKAPQEKPAPIEKPVVEAKPAEAVKPAAVEKPAAEVKPSEPVKAEAKPVKAVEEVKPAEEPKPVAEAKSVKAEKAPEAKKPAAPAEKPAPKLPANFRPMLVPSLSTVQAPAPVKEAPKAEPVKPGFVPHLVRLSVTEEKPVEEKPAEEKPVVEEKPAEEAAAPEAVTETEKAPIPAAAEEQSLTEEEEKHLVSVIAATVAEDHDEEGRVSLMDVNARLHTLLEDYSPAKYRFSHILALVREADELVLENRATGTGSRAYFVSLPKAEAAEEAPVAAEGAPAVNTEEAPAVASETVAEPVEAEKTAAPEAEAVPVEAEKTDEPEEIPAAVETPAPAKKSSRRRPSRAKKSAEKKPEAEQAPETVTAPAEAPAVEKTAEPEEISAAVETPAPAKKPSRRRPSRAKKSAEKKPEAEKVPEAVTVPAEASAPAVTEAAPVAEKAEETAAPAKKPARKRPSRAKKPAEKKSEAEKAPETPNEN